MVTRHEFLARLHEMLGPNVYMETGVQSGESLRLAHAAEVAIGIDPQPLIGQSGNQLIYPMASREFFSNEMISKHLVGRGQLDLGFIDGSHLIEDVLIDFIGMEKISHRRTVIVFDDVLPYSQEIAARAMPPAGDWTGDAWKIIPILTGHLSLYGAEMMMVNSFPTGLFVVWNLPIRTHTTGWGLVKLELNYEDLVAQWIGTETVPQYIIDRSKAHEPEDVLDRIREDLCESQ